MFRFSLLSQSPRSPPEGRAHQQRHTRPRSRSIEAFAASAPKHAFRRRGLVLHPSSGLLPPSTPPAPPTHPLSRSRRTIFRYPHVGLARRVRRNMPFRGWGANLHRPYPCYRGERPTSPPAHPLSRSTGWSPLGGIDVTSASVGVRGRTLAASAPRTMGFGGRMVVTSSLGRYPRTEPASTAARARYRGPLWVSPLGEGVDLSLNERTAGCPLGAARDQIGLSRRARRELCLSLVGCGPQRQLFPGRHPGVQRPPATPNTLAVVVYRGK